MAEEKTSRRWRVFISVDPSEEQALLQSAGGVIPEEDYALMKWESPDDLAGRVELALDVSGADEAEALKSVEDLYGAWRNLAGLEHAEGGLLALSPTEEAPQEQALKKAAGLGLASRYEEAIVFGQVACEVGAGNLLAFLLQDLGLSPETASAMARSPSLLNRRHQQILEDLVEVRIQDEDWWASYRRHVERRNLIVHAGARVTAKQADESQEAVEHFCRFLDSVWARLMAADS